MIVYAIDWSGIVDLYYMCYVLIGLNVGYVLQVTIYILRLAQEDLVVNQEM